jgi:hypothetical protein
MAFNASQHNAPEVNPQMIDIVDMAIPVGGARESQSFVWKI